MKWNENCVYHTTTFFYKKDIYRETEAENRQNLRNTYETQAGRVSENNLKKLFLLENFDQTRKKIEKNPLHASQDLNIVFLASQLPNLGYSCHWKC